MKKHFLFLGLLSLGLMTSCVKDQFVASDIQAEDKVEVAATLYDATQTRTQLNAEFKTEWAENDALSVFSSDEECHDRYYLKAGAGTTKADFIWDKSFNGEISGGIEVGGSNASFFAGLYPFDPEASVEFVDETTIKFNTVIRTEQKYAENSFGQDAAPMVGVDFINSKPNFSFKNVATVLIFSLNGDALINSVTLRSESSNIAGKAVITLAEDAENGFVPTTSVAEGAKEITLSCGEGVQLKGEEYTKFCIALAPGVYKDLVVKYKDTYGNYCEQEIANQSGKEMKASYTYNMPKMTFDPKKTEDIDLWVRANASSYMESDRIVPSVTENNIIDWVKALKDNPNAKVLIEQAIVHILAQEFELAYDVLNGIPGFARQYKRFEATGTALEYVDYDGSTYVKSFLEDLNEVKDIESLLNFLLEFEEAYVAVGAKAQIDAALDEAIEKFLGLDEETEDYEDPKVFADFKSTLQTQLKTSKGVAEGCLKAIDAKQEGIKNPFYPLGKEYTVEPDPEFMAKEEPQIIAYINAIDRLLEDLPNITEYAILKARIEALPEIHVQYEFDLTITKYKIDKTFSGAEFLTGENFDLLESMRNNALIRAMLTQGVEKIKTTSMTTVLSEALANPNSISAKFLTYLFEQEQFLETIKKVIYDSVVAIEEASKDLIDGDNMFIKNNAINTAKVRAITNALINAEKQLFADLAATNEEITNGGAWGLFKKILKWKYCVKVFTDLNLLEVYDALVEFTGVVDSFITYDKGTVTPVKPVDATFSQYEENVDWWLLTFNDEL